MKRPQRPLLIGLAGMLALTACGSDSTSSTDAAQSNDTQVFEQQTPEGSSTEPSDSIRIDPKNQNTDAILGTEDEDYEPPPPPVTLPPETLLEKETDEEPQTAPPATEPDEEPEATTVGAPACGPLATIDVDGTEGQTQYSEGLLSPAEAVAAAGHCDMISVENSVVIDWFTRYAPNDDTRQFEKSEEQSSQTETSLEPEEIAEVIYDAVVAAEPAGTYDAFVPDSSQGDGWSQTELLIEGNAGIGWDVFVLDEPAEFPGGTLIEIRSVRDLDRFEDEFRFSESFVPRANAAFGREMDIADSIDWELTGWSFGTSRITASETVFGVLDFVVGDGDGDKAVYKERLQNAMTRPIRQESDDEDGVYVLSGRGAWGFEYSETEQQFVGYYSLLVE